MDSKYIGRYGDQDEFFAVNSDDVERVIRANSQYGTRAERYAACMSILRRGNPISDGSMTIRLRAR